MQEKDGILMFEDGGLDKEYQGLLDYGIPMITLEKIRERHISMEKLREDYFRIDEFDEYEKMLMKDFFSLL